MLTRLDRLARLLDDQFELPLVKVRVGLDPIIGLIPGGGDWATWIVSLYILLEAVTLRVPLRVLAKIGSVVTLDLLIGYAPGVGDLLDVVFKANRRSVQLLMEHFGARYDARAPDRIVVSDDALERPRAGFERWPFAIILIVVFTAMAILPIAVLWWLLFVAIATWILLRTRTGNWIFAVGGSAASARATPTRCCWPPESWAG